MERRSGSTTPSSSATATTGIRAGPSPRSPAPSTGSRCTRTTTATRSAFEGKRVVVVGGGNSGVDIAVATSRVAERTFVSLRRGVHVIRKRLGGKPVDQQLAPPWLPWPLKQKGFELLRWRSGSISEHGFPEPDHKVGHAHPTVSDDFLDRLADGAIVPKPNIRELRGDRVEFEDGSVEEVDAIVYCTGYRVSFPFFDPDFVSAPGQRPAALPPALSPGDPRPLLRRAGAAARGDHADGRGVRRSGSPSSSPVGTGCRDGRDASRHGGRARGAREALLPLCAAHDGGRLRRVARRRPQGARARGEARGRERLPARGG